LTNHQHQCQIRIFMNRKSLCIWDQVGIAYYELLQLSPSLKPSLNATDINYLIWMSTQRKTPVKRHDKIILLHDNVRPHVAEPVKKILEALGWNVPYALFTRRCSFRLLLVLIDAAWIEQHFSYLKNIKKWLDDWITLKKT